MLPDDLKNFRAQNHHEPEDAFQIMTPADAGLGLLCFLAYCAIFWSYFK